MHGLGQRLRSTVQSEDKQTDVVRESSLQLFCYPLECCFITNRQIMWAVSIYTNTIYNLFANVLSKIQYVN